MKTKMSKPIAILISDVHYSLKNLELSDKAFRKAIDRAADLDVPLIDCGDLTNDKAILRAEVVNQLILTMAYAKNKGVRVVALVGNHSLINEKSHEHALHFLKAHCLVVDSPDECWGFNLIPYQNDPSKFLDAIQKFPKGSIVIGHQGTIGGQLGDYVKDSSAINPEDVKDWIVFLGHFHAHYILGTTVSIGNPFTMSFGEANDGPKGFLILNSDGTYTREILNLRKHVKIEIDLDEDGWFKEFPDTEQDDIIWLKIKGPYSEVKSITKEGLGNSLFGHSNFKLDLIPTDDSSTPIEVETLTAFEVFDKLIDNTSESDEQKTKLKAIWRELI